MALTSQQLAALRAGRWTVRRYLSVCPRKPVFQAQVSSVTRDSYTNGIVALGFTNVTLGVYTAAIPGLTIDVGSAPGLRDKGILRSRKTPTSSTLYVNETAPGKVNVQQGDWLTVREERLIWQKLPYLLAQKTSGSPYYDSFDLRVDYDVNYSNEHSQYRPLANIFGQMAGWAEEDGWRTVRLSANHPLAPSVAVAKGATISSYEWVVFDGVIEQGYSKYDPEIVVRFPASRMFRYIGLIVTDSNGQTSTKYFPIFVHSPAHPPLPYTVGFEIQSDETAEGREMQVSIFGAPEAVNENVLPRGTLMIYWEDTQVEGLETLPDEYRRQFMGWSVADAAELREGRGRYEVTIAGPQRWLASISGIQESFLRRSTPTRWYHMRDITNNRVIASLLRYRSTALDLCNLVLSDVEHEWGQPDNSDFAAVKVDKGSLWDQITLLANEISGEVGVDSNGTIWMRRNPCLMPSGRNNVPVTLALTERDWRDEQPFVYNDDFISQIGSITVDGFYWTGTESVPLRSRAPGRTPDYGSPSDSVATQVLTAASKAAAEEALKALAGHWLAWLNNQGKTMSVALLGLLDVVEPARREWLVIDSAAANVRGLLLDNKRFLVRSVSIEHSAVPPYKHVSLTLTPETEGLPGEIVPIPESDVLPDEWDYPDDWYPGDWDTETEPGQFWIDGETNVIAMFGIQGYLYRTWNFLSDSPTWSSYFLNLAGHILCFVVDAFSPGYMGAGSQINGWLATSQAIYKITDIFGTTPTITLCYSYGYTLNYDNNPVLTSYGVGMDASFGTPNHVVVAIPASSNGYGRVRVLYTRDGTNFTPTLPPWTETGEYTRVYPGVYVSPRTAGLVYVAAPYQGRLVGLFISTNYGASFARSTSHGPRHPYPDLYWNGSDVLHVPYDNNPNEDDLYFRRMYNNDSKLYRLRNGVNTDITPIFEGQNVWGPNRCRWSGMTAPLNRNRLAYVGQHNWNGKLFLSQDGGDSWVEQSAIRHEHSQVAISGDNPDILYAWGHNWDLVLGYRPRIWYGTGWGASWQDKKGNLLSLAPQNESIVGICGGPSG